jgi:hypothetical protein
VALPRKRPPPARQLVQHDPEYPFLFQDEWRQDQQLPGAMQFLCVPCLKIHNGVAYPSVDAVTHLALYPIQPQSPTFLPFVIDQFLRGQQVVQQLPVEYLMVPSTKAPPVTDTKKSSWGRLKELYR